MIIPRLIVPLTLAAVALITGQAFAQDAAPAPGAASDRDTCISGFASLREEAEQRGKLIKVASERHAPPDEVCKLIGSFGRSEIRLIAYIEANSACGALPRVIEQLRTGHRNTEAMQNKVCALAQTGGQSGLNDMPWPPRRGPVGDFDTIR